MKRHVPNPLLLVARVVLVLSSAAGAVARAQPADGLGACIASLRSELPSHAAVRAETFDSLTATAQDLRPVIDAATQNQPEFKLAVWDYVARLADAQRAMDGKQIMAREAVPLEGISRRSGVDAATVVSVFGVETDYGRVRGKYPVVDATLSRACLNLSSQERKNHFFAALQLVQDGLVQPQDFVGSWAGAFGMTQFMPGTFMRYKAAADASAKPDIIGNPADALATTASFLVGLGWSQGLRWGVEVKATKDAVMRWNALERDHACVTGNGEGRCRTVAQWAALGVAPVSAVDRANWPATTRAALFAPAGEQGPVWLVSRNFHALWGYNRADAYALSIGLLSDALRGDAPLQAAWPTDDPAIGRIEFRELQSLLLARGHADVVPDGYDGPKTRDAIRAEEASHGLAETGRGGARLLNLLRGAAPAAAASAASQ